MKQLARRNYENFEKTVKFLAFKVNKSVYIAKSRQRYYQILNNISLHVPNHALKDVYMLNNGTIKSTNSSCYTLFLITIIIFFSHIISSKHTHLVFCTFFRICPTIFECWHGWRKRINFKKQKFSLRVSDFACFFPASCSL